MQTEIPGIFKAFMRTGVDILLQPVAWSDGLPNITSAGFERKNNSTNIY